MSTSRDPRPKILIIHNSVSVARFLEGILRKGFEVKIAPTLQQALDCLKIEPPDLVLCHCAHLDNGDGELLCTATGAGAWDAIPLVIVVDEGQRVDTQLMKHLWGAVDYVSKSTDPRLLSWKLHNWIHLKNELSRLRISEAAALEECSRLESRIQMFIHDLTSQTLALRGFVKRLKQHLISGHQEDRRDETVQCLDEVSRSMEDFLRHSSESPLGRSPGEGWELLRLDEIAWDVVKQQQQLTREKGIEVEVTAMGEPPLIMGSRHRVRQVFDNLITNAVKHMRGRTHPSVTITIMQNGRSVITKISDNGMGIPPEYSEAVFKPFFRISDEAGKTGSGLGLSIVKQIVESHRGRVWVESEPGKGATFTFTLPKPVPENLSS